MAYLLRQAGGRLVLQAGTGDLLLEASGVVPPPAPVVVGGASGGGMPLDRWKKYDGPPKQPPLKALPRPKPPRERVVTALAPAVVVGLGMAEVAPAALGLAGGVAVAAGAGSAVLPPGSARWWSAARGEARGRHRGEELWLLWVE